MAYSLIRKLFYGINASKLSELKLSQKWTLFSACLIFMGLSMAALSKAILRIHDLIIDEPDNYFTDFFITLFTLYITSMGIAFIFVYSFLLHRLVSTFEDSHHAISNQLYYIYVAVFIFTLLLSIIIVILGQLQVSNAWNSNTILTLGVIPGVLACISFIYQFNSRLYKLIFEEKEISMTDPNALTEKQIKLLSIVTKHTVLGISMGIIVIPIVVGYWFAVLIYSGFGQDWDYRQQILSTYPLDIWYIVFCDIAHVAGFCMFSFMIYCGFTANKKYYSKLCQCCDTKFREYKGRKAIRKLEQREYRHANDKSNTGTSTKGSTKTFERTKTPTYPTYERTKSGKGTVLRMKTPTYPINYQRTLSSQIGHGQEITALKTRDTTMIMPDGSTQMVAISKTPTLPTYERTKSPSDNTELIQNEITNIDDTLYDDQTKGSQARLTQVFKE